MQKTEYRTRTTENGIRSAERGLFSACELVNEPKNKACVLNVAQIFAAIEKIARGKCANKMLYSTSYNEYLKEKQTYKG